MSHLDLWFEFASTYSYLSVARIGAIASAAGVSVRWQPFLLGPIFAKQGWNDSPFNLYAAKGEYMWRDMERLCEGYGLPFRKPSVFPRNGLLAARIASAGRDEAWLPGFVEAVYAANFARDREISDPTFLAGVLDTLGASGKRVIEAAGSPLIKQRLRDQTDRAQAVGIFGAPTFAIDGELFWGNDRLGDAITWARLGLSGKKPS